VACPEEIAYRSGYITAEEEERIGNSMKNNSYGAYLLQLLVIIDLTRPLFLAIISSWKAP